MYTVLLAGTEIDTERINWSKQKGKYEKKKLFARVLLFPLGEFREKSFLKIS